MKNLYLKIIKTVENNREEFLKRGLLPVETIDLYDGQPEDPTGYEFTCPALFMDYKISWERGGLKRKGGVITLDVHVLTHSEGGSENFSNLLPESLQKIEYYNLIADLLETVSTGNVGRLALTEEEPVVTENFCYHLLHFDAAIFKVTEEPGVKPGKVNFKISSK